MKNSIINHKSSRKSKAIFLCLSLLLYTSCSDITDKAENNNNKTERIIETGQLRAVENHSFILQQQGRYWQEYKVVGLLKHGTIIEKGDSIMQFDVTELQKNVVESEAMLENNQAALQQLIIKQNNQIFNLENQLKSEASAFELKKLEMEAVRFETEKTKKIKKLEFEQAKIRFELTKHSVEIRKKILKSNLAIQKLGLNQIQKRIDEFKSNIPKMTIRSSVSGIFQVGDKWGERPIKIGDKLYPGQKLGNVPNIKWMKVETQVSELDFLKIEEGQSVTVRLDAMPNLKFRGKVNRISKFCYKKDKKSHQKVFDVEVLLLDSDERLKPGMTVSCEFL